MQYKLKVFVFDSRNTGCYKWQGDSILAAMNYARQQPHARIEYGADFWEYENGEMVSWNAPMANTMRY